MAKSGGPAKGGHIGGVTPIPPGYHQPKGPGKSGFKNFPGKHRDPQTKPCKGK